MTGRAVHVVRGLPGSGKSTLARRIPGAAHVELDAHRRRLWPGCPPSWDPYRGLGLRVQAAFEAEVAGLLAAGRDVVLDRTNLALEGLRRIERLAPGARLVIHDLRGTPVADCLARDHARPPATRVGPDGIHALARRWL